MPDVFLREHKGVKVYVGDDGKFYATVGKNLVSRKDLRSVEREIEKALPRATAWPGRKVFTVGERAYEGVNACNVYTVVSVHSAKRRGYSTTEMVTAEGKDLRYGSYYAYDETAIKRLTDLVGKITVLQAEKERILKSLKDVSAYTVLKEIDAWEAEQVKKMKETDNSNQIADAGA